MLDIYISRAQDAQVAVPNLKKPGHENLGTLGHVGHGKKGNFDNLLKTLKMFRAHPPIWARLL